MRLAIIRQRYNPYGGAERFVERAATALAEQGATISVVAREWAGSHGAQPTSGNVRWQACNPPYLGRLARDARFARAACALVEREHFDLVQSHERIACCDIYRAGDGVHRQWLDYRSRSMGAAARLAMSLSPYHRYVLRAELRLFASKRLRAVICNSHMVRADIQRHYGVADTKLHVIYNGVDLEAFQPRLREVHRTRMRQSLNLAEDTFVYVLVGSGFERKGIPQLLRAFARMRSNHPSQLVVVGKDKATRRMQRLAIELGVQANVLFAGPQTDVAPWYAMADCFVLPTLYDPFPNAALEALACGLPIVVSRQCGAAELVERGKNGFVCDANEPESIAQAMQQVSALAVDEATRAARASVRELSLQSMAERLVALYRRLLDK